MHSTARSTALLVTMLGAFILLVAWVLGGTSSNAQANPLRGELDGQGASLLTESALPDSSPTSTPACGLAWRGVEHAGTTLGTQLNGIAAISPNDIWAAGYVTSGVSPFVEHWDGTNWTAVPVEPVPGNFTMFNDVVALASNDVWAVGHVGWSGADSHTETLVQHWDGTAWSRVLSMNPADRHNSFDAVAAFAANDIWAVGYALKAVEGYKRSMIQHWDGTSWSVIPSPTLGTRDNRLYDVTAIASNDAWAVGHYHDYPDPFKTLLLHWDGTAWTPVQGVNPNPLGNHAYTVAAVAPDDVWAAGTFGLYPMFMLHWDGTAWTSVEVPGNFDVYGLYARDPQDIWAVGKADRAHWNGVQWSLVPGPRSSLQDVVSFGPDQAWAVGPVVERYSDPCAITTATTTSSPTAPPTSTVTPTATHTRQPSPSPTGIINCLVSVSEATASCSLPETYTYHFHLYSTGGCYYSARIELQAAPDIGGPWTTIAEHGVPVGPGSVDVDGTFPVTIPQQYDWYRVRISGYYGWPPFEATTNPAYVCSRATGTATAVPSSSATPSACTLTFTDVPPTNTFYPFVRCLACKGIVQGYQCGGAGEPCNPSSDPYFRPNNYVTRGQLAKIVSESAGFDDQIPTSQWTFTDVPYSSTFWLWVERLSNRQVMSGYQCGSSTEPCDSENRPYFRPNAGATRGQLTKIVSNAAGFSDAIPNTQYTFADVPPSNTFWLYVERLLLNRPGVMEGYPCGAPTEPCDSENRPYFRPNNPLTRGQTSKIVANTFFPDCSVASR